MKKFTKIIALALALALVLGMSAMAAALTAPTNIIIYDDFSDVDSIDTFKATRTNVGTALGTTNYSPAAFSAGIGAVRQAAIDAGTPLTGTNNTHFFATSAYGGTPFEVVKDDAGNTIALRDTSGDKRGYLMYALPEAFTTEDAAENQKAIVFQYTWNPYVLRSAGASHGQLANAMFIKTDGTEAAGTGSFGVNAVKNTETEAIDTVTVSYQGGETAASKMPANTDYTVQRVHRLYNPYNEDEIWTPENTNGNFPNYLIHFSVFERAYNYGGHFYESGTANQAKAIQAFYWTQNNNRQEQFSDVIIYEVSIKSEDFHLDTTTVNNVELDGALELEFSQPLSANVGSLTEGDKDTEGSALAENLVVNDGTKDLVYGTDYTVEISEKVDGSEVKGILSVIPAVDWAYGQTITVTIPDNMKSVARRTIYAESNKVATFNTVKAPSFNLTLTGAEGLAAGTTITAANAAGKTVFFTANATNTTGRAINGVLAIGIYDAEGNLVKYAYADKAFTDGGNNSFSAAFKMEANQTAKAFVKGTASEAAFQ